MSTALATVSEMPKTELAASLVRARSALAQARAHGKQMGRAMVGQACAAAGGAIAGVLEAKMPLIPRTNVPSDVALGAALGLGVALDVFDGANDYVAFLAAGLLGAGAAREAKKILTR